MCHQMATLHAAVKTSTQGAVKPTRGRPRTANEKRARFDNWNAFVSANPISSMEEFVGENPHEVIRSGQYLKALSREWKSMSRNQQNQEFGKQLLKVLGIG